MSTAISPAAKGTQEIKSPSTNETYKANEQRAAARKSEAPKPNPPEVKAPEQPTPVVNTSGQTVGRLVNTTA